MSEEQEGPRRITLGQMAYEAYWQCAADEFGAAADDDAPSPASWGSQPAWSQRAAEAAAKVVADYVSACAVLDAPDPEEPKPITRYALVEQMGHRATVATIRETTFAGKPMIEMTAVKTGAVHLVAPESLYEITWITEADALARSHGVHWTAVALPAAGDDDDDDPEVRENGGVWGFTEADL